MDRRDEASPDYYQRLGVEPTASAEEIREAYRKKARHTHPDRNPEDPRAAENFRRVKEAYRVLRDPERRAQYDASPGPSESPEVVRLSQQVAMGCTGYLWRVFAGIVAVGLFFLLELFDVWSAQGVWVIGLAVGGASLVAGLIAAVAARYFPDQAGDVTIRLSSERLKMWADGHLALDLSWSRAQAVRLREGGGLLELEVDPESAPRVHPVPPVLIHVDRDRDRGLLRFDLSATDVRGAVLRSFLETEDPIPFANANVEEQTRHNGSNVTGNGS